MAEQQAPPLTIQEFLRARLDEEQAEAEDAAARISPEDTPGYEWYANQADSSGDSIVAMSPARALAEVAAKRGILRWHSILERWIEHEDAFNEMGREVKMAEVAAVEIVLRHLAKPYSYHPDWRADW